MEKKLKEQLVDKMWEEQETYEKWFVKQPAVTILQHSYEHAVRQDIIIALEEMDLCDEYAQALLKCPSPLQMVYDHYCCWETDYMSDLREAVYEEAAHLLAEKGKVM